MRMWDESDHVHTKQSGFDLIPFDVVECTGAIFGLGHAAISDWGRKTIPLAGQQTGPDGLGCHNFDHDLEKALELL